MVMITIHYSPDQQKQLETNTNARNAISEAKTISSESIFSKSTTTTAESKSSTSTEITKNTAQATNPAEAVAPEQETPIGELIQQLIGLLLEYLGVKQTEGQEAKTEEAGKPQENKEAHKAKNKGKAEHSDKHEESGKSEEKADGPFAKLTEAITGLTNAIKGLRRRRSCACN